MMMLSEDQVLEFVKRELAAVVPGLSLRTGSASMRRDRTAEDVVRDDLRGRLHGRDVVVEVKAMSTLRVQDLLGRLAMAVLRLRRRTVGRRALLPVVVVVVPKAGPKAWSAVEAFMAAEAPDVGWAVLDHAGNARVVIPPAKVDVRRGAARRPKEREVRRSVRLFSDLNSWMLKILFLDSAPPGLWGGPRARVSSPTELHRLAKVSLESAHRFVRTLEARDFLRRDRDGLRLVRLRELIDLWWADAALRAQPPVPVRWMLGRPRDQSAALTGREPPDLVVGGFDACRRLGVLHAPVGGLELHALRPVDDVLAARHLERCAPHEADLRLLRCTTPQSVLRGSVIRKDTRVVDALQAALDVAHRPERGREQSDYIIDRVLHLADER